MRNDEMTEGGDLGLTLGGTMFIHSKGASCHPRVSQEQEELPPIHSIPSWHPLGNLEGAVIQQGVIQDEAYLCIHPIRFFIHPLFNKFIEDSLLAVPG